MRLSAIRCPSLSFLGIFETMRFNCFTRLFILFAVVFNAANSNLYAHEQTVVSPSHKQINQPFHRSQQSFSAILLPFSEIILTPVRITITSQTTIDKRESGIGFYSFSVVACRYVLHQKNKSISAGNIHSNLLGFIYPFHHFW